MSQLFGSDYHVNHSRIIELDNRPFASIEEMNTELIIRHNSLVLPEDTWHAVGDMLMGQNFLENVDIFGQFNGRRKLYPGNHDRVSHTNKLKERRKHWNAYSKFFEIMPDNFQIELQGNVFNISHFPYKDGGDHTEEERHSKYRMEDNGIPLICGHTHSTEKVSFSKKGTLQINVGVMAWDWYPAHENEIIELLEKHG